MCDELNLENNLESTDKRTRLLTPTTSPPTRPSQKMFLDFNLTWSWPTLKLAYITKNRNNIFQTSTQQISSKIWNDYSLKLKYGFRNRDYNTKTSHFSSLSSKTKTRQSQFWPPPRRRTYLFSAVAAARGPSAVLSPSCCFSASPTYHSTKLNKSEKKQK